MSETISVKAPELIDDSKFTNKELSKMLQEDIIRLSNLRQERAREVVDYMTIGEGNEQERK